MTNTNTRWIVAFTLIMCVALAWAPGSVAAGHALVVSSIHESDTDFQNAESLENVSISGSGTSAYVEYVIGGTSAYYNVVDDDGDGTASYSQRFVGDDGSGNTYSSEAKIQPTATGPIQNITLDINGIEGSDYGASVDIYIVKENPDDVYGEGTLVKSGWDPDWGFGSQTIEFDSEYQVDKNTNYTIEFVTTNTDNDGNTDAIYIAGDDDSGFTNWFTVNLESNPSIGADIGFTITQYGTGQYISQNHSATNVDEGFTNLTLDNATATVKWEYWDGSSWQVDNSSTFSSSGNHTIPLSASADTWRVNVTYQNTTNYPTAQLHDEGVRVPARKPTGSNISPVDGTKLTDSEVDFSIDISDADFTTEQGDSVTATLYTKSPTQNSFSQEYQTTISSNQTVSTTQTISDGGDHDYYWTLNDSYGESTTTTTNTISVPSTLYIYNETKNSTGQHELLDNATIDITATITGSNQTVFETTVTDGTIDFTGLPADETYIITLESQDFHTREVYVSSIYDQEAVFLLNTIIASVRNDISVNDRTGRYSDNPIIIVDRVINTSNVSQLSVNGYDWVAIGGDRLGASGIYTIDLQQDARYRFRVINQDGDTRVLGEYTAKDSGSITLEIGSISYELSPDGKEYEWTTNLKNTSTGGQLTFSYNDGANLTSELNLTIRYRNNSTILTQQTFTSGPYGEITYIQPLSQDEYENESFIIEWNATRDGETINGEAYEGSRQQISLPLSNVWLQVGYAGLILSFAFLVGAGVSAGAGSMVVVSFAGFGWYLGIVPSELGAGAVILGLLIAGIQHMLTQSTTQGVR